MLIRNFVPGDELRQSHLYNRVAAQLPGFRALNADELRRQTTRHGFEPTTHFFAEQADQLVGICSFDPASGLVTYPWCLSGHEAAGHQCFAAVMRAMSARGMNWAYVAVRHDWQSVIDYFDDHGFMRIRDMINYSQPICDLPTMFQRPGLNISAVTPADIPGIEKLGTSVLRKRGAKLVRHLTDNPRFPNDAIFVLRRKDGTIKGAAVMIDDVAFSPVEQMDPVSPQFRFGAFGTEGFAGERVNGLFSFLCEDSSEAEGIGQDMLWYATSRLERSSFDTLATQVPSDAKHLVRFYDRFFHRDGSFAVYGREVGSASGF